MATRIPLVLAAGAVQQFQSGDNLSFGYGQVFSTGNWVLQNGGTFIDAGYRLDVQGTLRVSASVSITLATTATGNYGTLSLGDGAFDGVTAGFFTGGSGGTIIASNLSASSGRFIEAQIAGVSYFRVSQSLGSSGGTLTRWGVGTVSPSAVFQLSDTQYTTGGTLGQTAGFGLRFDAATFTTTTASTATVASAGVHTFATPTVAATVSAGFTVTELGTILIQGAPILSGTIAATNRRALVIANGGMSVLAGASLFAGALSITGATTFGNNATLFAGTTTVAPLTFTSGTLKTSATAGIMEYDGTNFYLSPSTTRKRIALSNNATPANGQLPIGNGTDYTVASLTQDIGITITAAAGTITIGAEGLQSKAGDPTTTEVAASKVRVYKNTTSGAVKLWVNDAGTLKSVALT